MVKVLIIVTYMWKSDGSCNRANACSFDLFVLFQTVFQFTGTSSSSTADGTEKDYEWVLPVAVGSLVMFMYATNIGLLSKIGH